MKPLKLTICICSMPQRSRTLVALLEDLTKQRRIDEVQILVNMDAGQQQRGVKRNYMIFNALGEYIVHIDDDDAVHVDYVGKILDAIDANPGVDAIVLRGVRIDLHANHDALLFDYRVMLGDVAVTEGEVLWRSPGHLCPVRHDIVQAHPFPEIEPEDLLWVAAIAPHIKTIARAGHEGEVLYHYLWDSKKIDRYNAR